MRTAICISGLTRNYQRSLESIKKHFPSADIFIHTYNIKATDSLNSHSKNLTEEYFSIENLGPFNICTLFKPTLFNIEEYDALSEMFKFICFMARTDNLSAVSMYYSIKAANDLKTRYEKENNFIYDRVLRMRFDLEITDYKEEHLRNDMLNIPKSTYTRALENPDPYIDIIDIFAAGPSKLIDVYSDVFTSFIEYQHKSQNYYSEAILGYYLKEKIADKLYRSDVDVNILRSRKTIVLDINFSSEALDLDPTSNNDDVKFKTYLMENSSDQDILEYVLLQEEELKAAFHIHKTEKTWTLIGHYLKPEVYNCAINSLLEEAKKYGAVVVQDLESQPRTVTSYLIL